MSGRHVTVGRGGGGRGCGDRRDGRGGRKQNKNFPWKPKQSAHTSSTPAIKDDVIDCEKPEHVAQFDGAKKAIINYVRMTGEREAMSIANAEEAMIAPTIPQPPRPPQIV